MTMHHKYSLTEIEGLIPWERDMYVSMISDYIKTENDRSAAEANKKH